MARVTGPDGRQWRIGRQWLPWQLRRRKLDSGGGDGDGGFSLFDAADDPLSALAIFVVAIIAAVAFAFLAPFLLLGLELALVLVLVPVVAASRLLLRRPFTVTARELGRATPAATQQVVGWRASGRTIERWAGQVRQGVSPGSAS